MGSSHRLSRPFLVLHTWRAGWGGWTTINVLRDLGGYLSVDRAQIDTSQSSWVRDSSITLVLAILDHLFQILQDLKVVLARWKHGRLWVIVLLLLLLLVYESVKAKLVVCREWRRGLLLLLLVASG